MAKKLTPAEKKVIAVWKAINHPVSYGMSYYEMTGRDWNVFSKSFGWFEVSRDLSDEQIKQIQALWEAQRKSQDVGSQTGL